MQALISFLVANVMAFWPFVLIDEWERGVRVRLGRLREELGPGLHWRWPFIDKVISEITTEQTINLPSCAVTTNDGQAVVLSANICYRIASPRQVWASVTDFDESLSDLMLGLLAQYCSNYEWAALQHSRARIQNTLQRKLTETLKEWGVQVVRVKLTDFVLARQYNLFGMAG